MDLLLHDVFDLPVAAGRYVEHGQLQLDDMLDSPALAANLAFHEAWACVLGVRPTRADFAALAARGGQAGADSLAVWNGTTSAALTAALADGTPLRLLSSAGQLIERASEAYQRALASVGPLAASAASADAASSRRRRVLAAVVAKLADRFGADAEAQVAACDGDVTRLPGVYAAMVASDPALKQLERWAFGGDDGGAGHRKPATVVEYYDRVAAAAAVPSVGLPTRSPVTGFVVARGRGTPAMPAAMSAVELVRYPLSHDLFLWRRDSGGSVVLCSPADTTGLRAIAERSEPDRFRLRTVSGPPPALMLAALPSLYVRVLVDAADGEDADAAERARVAGRFPEVVAVAPAVDVDLSPAPASGGRRIAMSGAWARDAFAASGGVASPAPGARARYWLPTADALYGAPSRAPHWAPALASAALSTHLLHACPVSRSADAAAQPAIDGSGALMMQHFVTRYASARELGRRVFVTAPPGEAGRTGELVLIDSRPNVWSVLAVLVTLDNLRAGDWSVAVLCGEGNRKWMSEALLPHVPHARVEVLPELSRGAFDIEEYNVLLKSPALWRRLVRGGAVRRVLTVQDDGMLARPGLDDDAELLAQAFVGAPWTRSDEAYRAIMEEAGVPEAFVGNGGLSLRDPAMMLEIAESAEADGLSRALFNGNLQPLPEDVMFAVALARRGMSAPRAVAQRFAFEELPPAAAEMPFGFHKPWPYMPASAAADAFERMLLAR